jgi:phenylacetate-CoA ligase
VSANPESLERASVDELRAVQLDRLKWAVRHAYENVEHYQRSFHAHGVHPDDLKAHSDLARSSVRSAKRSGWWTGGAPSW